MSAPSQTTASTVSTPSVTLTPKRTPLVDYAIFQLVTLAATFVITGMFSKHTSAHTAFPRGHTYSSSLASRVKTIWPYRYALLNTQNTLRWLALSIPIFAIFFLISTTMLLSVRDVATEHHCHASIIVGCQLCIRIASLFDTSAHSVPH